MAASSSREYRGTPSRAPAGAGSRSLSDTVWPNVGAATTTPLAGAGCSSSRKARTCRAGGHDNAV